MSIRLPCKKPDLFKITPHQHRMLLLDQIDAYDLEQSSIKTSLTIHQDSEFLDQSNQKMPTWVSFEYFAQSIAALSGIVHIQDGNEPKIGFIMGIRDLDLNQPFFDIGATLDISVQQEFRDGDVAVFKGSVFVDGEEYCSGSLSVIENNAELMNYWKNEF